MNEQVVDILAWKLAQSYARMFAKMASSDKIDPWSEYESSLALVNQPGGREYYLKHFRDAARLKRPKGIRRKKAQVFNFPTQF
jgi:hypothetical protein